MGFKSALWDGSDPDYMPLVNWAGDWAYWRPSKKYRDMGYPPEQVALPGRKGDALGRERAAIARKLTREMLDTLGAAQKGVEVGTWGWLIYRYKTDAYSAYNDNIKHNTREGYDYTLGRWETAIGHLPIKQMNFEAIKQIELKMREKGRSQSNIKRMFTMLRMLANYGTVLNNPDAERVATVLSKLRLKTPPKRQVAMTPEQARAVIAAADKRGMHAFALGMLFQWTYALRPIDVRGDWFGGENDRQWRDGLTWNMFDADLTFFEKVISKTAKSMPEPMRYSLTDEIRERLMAISKDRVGPVIISERTGKPYTKYGWSQAFARLRKEAGVPKDVCLMDARSGALTEAQSLGASAIELRDMGVHSNINTTSGYVRGRSESIEKIVKLRSGK